MNKKIYATLTEAGLSSQYTNDSTKLTIYLVKDTSGNHPPLKPENFASVTPTAILKKKINKSSSTKAVLKASSDSSLKDIVDKKAVRKHYVNSASVWGVIAGIGSSILLFNALNKIKCLHHFL